MNTTMNTKEEYMMKGGSPMHAAIYAQLSTTYATLAIAAK